MRHEIFTDHNALSRSSSTPLRARRSQWIRHRTHRTWNWHANRPPRQTPERLEAWTTTTGTGCHLTMKAKNRCVVSWLPADCAALARGGPSYLQSTCGATAEQRLSDSWGDGDGLATVGRAGTALLTIGRAGCGYRFTIATTLPVFRVESCSTHSFHSRAASSWQ